MPPINKIHEVPDDTFSRFSQPRASVRARYTCDGRKSHGAMMRTKLFLVLLLLVGTYSSGFCDSESFSDGD